MADEDTNGNHTTEETVDGRSVKIDTGFYEVQVWGDPEDSFQEVFDRTMDACDRAREDVDSLDDRLDGDDRHYG